MHAKNSVSIYTLMSYVLHIYRMTYKTYDMQEYIFVHPEEWYSRETYSSGFFVFHPLVARKWACPWRLCASSHGANHRSVFNGIRFYSFQNIVSTKTQQGMFRVSRNLLGYSQKNLPVGDLFLRSRTIKMERAYKKHQKFLIFLTDKLDFIFLCKIRNNDRTIEYII